MSSPPPTRRFVLVHSPLIGPFSWRPVADQLASEGHQIVIPSLLPVLARSTGFAAAIAQIVADSVKGSGLTGPLVLTGHSAAGAYLPVISSYLDREILAYIFVDARLPRAGASLGDEDSPEERNRLRAMAEAGRLPPWSEWFGDQALRGILPQDEMRQQFKAELRSIPLALFEEKISFSSGWPNAPCGYIRLSGYYQELAREASARGWPVIEAEAGHLHLLTHPGKVARLLLDMIGKLRVE